jgi:hypothetical protein
LLGFRPKYQPLRPRKLNAAPEKDGALRYQSASALQRPAKARAYKVFLTLWKDADPDVPILKEAKAEYAKLGTTQ